MRELCARVSKADAALRQTPPSVGRERPPLPKSLLLRPASAHDCKAPHAIGRVVQEVAQESAQNPSAASAAVVASVAKREGEVRNRNLRGAEAAAKARAKRENKVVGAKGSDQHLEPARKAGVLLVGPGKENGRARRRAQLLRFTLASDPLGFVARVLKVPSSAKKGHAVIASPADTDYALSAMIAAAL